MVIVKQDEESEEEPGEEGVWAEVTVTKVEMVIAKTANLIFTLVMVLDFVLYWWMSVTLLYVITVLKVHYDYFKCLLIILLKLNFTIYILS